MHFTPLIKIFKIRFTSTKFKITSTEQYFQFKFLKCSIKFQGCPCYTYEYGCCPDGEAIARGPAQEGCTCKDREYGCCPDRRTPAEVRNISKLTNIINCFFFFFLLSLYMIQILFYGQISNLYMNFLSREQTKRDVVVQLVCLDVVLMETAPPLQITFRSIFLA